jgi:hypothetical protein
MPTQPPIQWVTGAISPELKWPGREADHGGQENMDLHIHSPIRFHGVVLNWLSTGTTLPLCYDKDFRYAVFAIFHLANLN